MKVLVIEDEQPASQKLVRLINKIDESIEVVDVVESVLGATNWLLSNTHPDLIFMDVQLEDGICFEIFENCEITTPVIFTTAFNEYALKAFKVNSVDYLLKPITENDLRSAIRKYKNVHDKLTLTKIESVLNQIKPKTKERFLIKVGNRLNSIQTSHINYFFIKERSNFINIGKGKNYPIDYSLEQVEKIIDSNVFFRVNRHTIVNFYAINDIISYSSSRLKIIIDTWSEDDEILVSRERVSDFKNWMDR